MKKLNSILLLLILMGCDLVEMGQDRGNDKANSVGYSLMVVNPCCA